MMKRNLIGINQPLDIYLVPSFMVRLKKISFFHALRFPWVSIIQYFIGYICTQWFGGYFSDKCCGKLCLLGGIFILSSTSVSMPFLARLDEIYVIFIRIVQGLVSGVAFPSLYNMFSTWSSTNERATLVSVVLSGLSLANVINLPFSATLCATIGWPAVFYVPGLVGLVWCLAFHFLCFSSPMDHPSISPEEQAFLARTSGSEDDKKRRKNLPTPFWQMMTSGPVHALWIVHLCHAWCYVRFSSLWVPITENTFFTLSVFDGCQFDFVRSRRSGARCGEQWYSIMSALSRHVSDDIYSGAI